MRVIICEPGKPAKALPAKDEPIRALTLRHFLGASWCEMYPEGFPNQIVMLANEGGAFSKGPQNGSVMICGSITPVFGTYIICRRGKDGKYYPMDEKVAEKVCAGLHQAPKEKTCCLCGQAYAGKGNNAAPLANGLCCNKCNEALVIPERMKQIEGIPTLINDSMLMKIREKPKPIPTQLEAIAALMCDHYCKYPDNCSNEDALAKICDSCPVGLLG